MRLPTAWRWPAVAILAIGIAAASLDIVGYLAQTPTQRFAGIAAATTDNYSYLAKIGQGYRGHWLMQLPYTSTPHAGAPVYTYYLALGQLGRLLGLPPLVVFYLARLVNGVLLLALVYHVAGLLAEGQAARRFTFLLAAVSSGLGWLALLLTGENLSVDLQMPEAITFLALLTVPHFTLSQAAMLAGALCYCAPRGTRRQEWGWRAAGALVLGLQAAIQPYIVPAILSTGGAYLLAVWRRDRQWPAHLAWRLAFSGLPAAAGLITMQGYLWADPVLRVFYAQTQLPSPPVWQYALGYGLLLIPAVPGAVRLARRRTNLDLWVLAWLVITAVGVYAPLAVQRRLAQGWHLAIAFTAGVGFCAAFWPRMASGRRWILSAVFLFITTFSNLALVLIYALVLIGHTPRSFVSQDESLALRWLAQQGEGVTLASEGLSIFIPAHTGQRAVSGHRYETVPYRETSAAVARFYGAGTSSAERRALLARWQPDFVVLGPRERALGLGALGPEDGLSLRVTFGQVSLYSPLETP